MLSKISLITLFLFYHVELIALENADSFFNLLDNETSSISFVHNEELPNKFITEKNTNTYFYNSKRFNVKEKIYINKSNVNYQKLFNNFYYVEIDTENESAYLPLVFSESINDNWEILEVKENFFKDQYFYNLFINFFEMSKYKVSFLNSKYFLVENKKYFTNNFSNFFLINKDKNNFKKKYIVYYKKAYLYQLILLIFVIFFPFVIYISIFIKKYE